MNQVQNAVASTFGLSVANIYRIDTDMSAGLAWLAANINYKDSRIFTNETTTVIKRNLFVGRVSLQLNQQLLGFAGISSNSYSNITANLIVQKLLYSPGGIYAPGGGNISSSGQVILQGAFTNLSSLVNGVLESSFLNGYLFVNIDNL